MQFPPPPTAAHLAARSPDKRMAMKLKYIFIQIFLLALVFFPGIYNLPIFLAHAADKQFYKNDILGKWAMLIKSDVERPNIIYLQLHFRKDGFVEYKGDGILINGEKAAIYTMTEIKKWRLENGFLYEDQIQCSLSSISGDPDLIVDVKNMFEQFKRDRNEGQWKSKIIDINAESIKLLPSDSGESNDALVYYNIE